MKNVITLSPEGKVKRIRIGDGEVPLDVLQRAVGGHIEYAPSIINGIVMLVNEEDQLKGFKVNEMATALYAYGHLDPLVGTVAFVHVEGENTFGLYDTVADKLERDLASEDNFEAMLKRIALIGA